VETTILKQIDTRKPPPSSPPKKKAPPPPVQPPPSPPLTKEKRKKDDNKKKAPPPPVETTILKQIDTRKPPPSSPPKKKAPPPPVQPPPSPPLTKKKRKKDDNEKKAPPPPVETKKKNKTLPQTPETMVNQTDQENSPPPLAKGKKKKYDNEKEAPQSPVEMKKENKNPPKKRSTSSGVNLPLSAKHLESSSRAKMHFVTSTKSLQKRDQRMNKEATEISNRILRKELLTYNGTPLQTPALEYNTYSHMMAQKQTFSDYFNLDEFEEGSKHEDAATFLFRLRTLWNRVLLELSVRQRSWIVDAQKNANQQQFTYSYEWLYCLSFNSFWKNDPDASDKNPVVEWLYVKQTEKNILGVFARRKFEAGEIVAIYFGFEKATGTNSEYAVTTRYGTFDPVRGLIGSGTHMYYMAMHIAKAADDSKPANAKLANNLLVKATRTIENGDEIFLEFETGVTKVPVVVSNQQNVKHQNNQAVPV
jgi:hypothetical protein